MNAMIRYARKNLFMLSMILLVNSCGPGDGKITPLTYEEYPVYTGNDLELQFTEAKTRFRIWSPMAEAAEVRLYERNEDSVPWKTLKMKRAENGTWTASYKGNLHHKFYTFRTRHDGLWLAETPGIYVKATGVNGYKGFICDPAEANPEGWDSDKGPVVQSFSDIILYELQVRDMSIHPNSGIQNKGLYKGLTERGTTNNWGQSTGLDHIAELGVTHVHLLPVFDFRTIDETRPEDNNYNWGYDPQNYNVPEGSFATDPHDPLVRIREFKEMVMAFHNSGIGVIMDVVYNHTSETENSNFNLLAPGYYYRHTPEGHWSNASGCGNETASEREMMRRYIIESVKYWATEYHIDGFRFDLMGIHDIETMNQVRAALNEINPSILIYGEGWLAGDSPLPEDQRAIKAHAYRMPGIAVFSDDLRDAVKGPWYNEHETGFVGAVQGLEESVKFGVVGSIQHPGIDYGNVNYSKAPYAAEPTQCINYVSCHDNHTLWDKIKLTVKGAGENELIRLNKLSNAIVLTAQGIPFLHNGVEMMRSKKYVENSYKSPDSINQIDWNWKHIYKSSMKFHQDLISLRKAHPAFRMQTAAQIQENLEFLPVHTSCVVAYTINGSNVGDPWKRILVAYNGNRNETRITIPQGKWKIFVNGDRVLEDGVMHTGGSTLHLPASSAMILAITE